jgi:hypothetical protein
MIIKSELNFDIHLRVIEIKIEIYMIVVIYDRRHLCYLLSEEFLHKTYFQSNRIHSPYFLELFFYDGVLDFATIGNKNNTTLFYKETIFKLMTLNTVYRGSNQMDN